LFTENWAYFLVADENFFPLATFLCSTAKPLLGICLANIPTKPDPMKCFNGKTTCPNALFFCFAII
jgi:hypothetical protein